jgi:hypothetical protein
MGQNKEMGRKYPSKPLSSLTKDTEKGKKKIKRTPCMTEGITDHVWSWNELLWYKIGQ